MTKLERKPGPAPLPLPAGWPLEDFCEHLLSVELQRKSTVRTRRLQLAAFGRQHPDPWTVSRHDVGIYMMVSAPETRKSLKAGLRGFYEWAAEAGLAEMDPTVGIKVRVPKTEPRPCPDEVWKGVEARLLASQDAQERATGLMIALAGRCGLRRAEVASTHTRWVEGRVIRVTGKGGVTRRVLLPPGVKEMIQAAPDGYLFPGARRGEPITADAVGRRISRELPPGWTAHTLRHRFATEFYRQTNNNLLMVQKALGHASPVTTERYILLTSDDDVRLAELMDE